jgi:hypothetical protein
VEKMLCSTLLPLAKSMDQLVQQNVDQVPPAHVDAAGCLGKYRRCFDDGSQAAARAVKESVASMGGARDARAVMAAKQVTCCYFQTLRAM